jgi:thiol-disulfide isomerase/thioredoxin
MQVNKPNHGRIAFFLDGKQVTSAVASEKLDRGEELSLSGVPDEPKLQKIAIKRYGEKYRHGIIILESDKQNIANDCFNLSGEIDKRFDGRNITLFTFKNDSIFTVDTTTVKNGTFHFQGKEYVEDFSMLSIGNWPDSLIWSLEVLLERGNISVNLTDKVETNRIGGTPLNDLYQSYFDSTRIAGKLDIELGIFSVNFKKENFSNIVGQKLFREEVYSSLSGVSAYGSHSNAFQIILDAADDEYKIKNKEWIESTLEKLKEDPSKDNLRTKLINKPYIDFTFQTPKGETKKLSDYVGKSKYLLIDFWASWCGPCIAEIPDLKKVYDKYKREEFEIISISLDETKAAWLSGLNKIDAPWIHLCDFQGKKSSQLTETYAIQAIPLKVLLDEKGHILSVNLSGSTLGNVLKKLINDN